MLIGGQYVHKDVGEGKEMINYLTIKLMWVSKPSKWIIWKQG